MAIRTDNPLDQELARQKAAFEIFKRRLSAFMNSYKNLNSKERSRSIRELHANFKAMSQFLDRMKSEPLTNSGARFILENLRQGYATQMSLWRKFEKRLDMDARGTTLEAVSENQTDIVEKAVQDFKDFLSVNGSTVTVDQVDEFKKHIEGKFHHIESQTGKTHHSVEFVLEKGQLKIKIHSSD